MVARRDNPSKLVGLENVPAVTRGGGRDREQRFADEDLGTG